ncbi:uncharacterized protein CG5098 [Toxorhynchites rutilus septentrionalis]|uniref:uncharacterized protein CG5098 n=1 Tax=Toxorhynchites rutilus septentrionalis TaxID=329112 RepID=UPI00247A3D04|nr:uncharacterized protein CG5098 [Toxorhynchites rutilus septentrionalis]XP_055624466.1 uncharacterized protein CG5098 [Toxorhynchites rutilus septentrionalis]XP_055624467.1 uncharacterized protein CG5098 [Toxorhynchites rutilus septentrionalis]XP_055624468.1 uncharacterized protein CG5098 [Toxorhynchites rutilus septentrionalis]XP_055624469.1 uncharacterized protein CG5098 [Toxorhynchites rutilus septentrionalis]
MSGHNPPHGRLGQPNSTWNPLQVPSYIPRQPQLAHMSSERSLARSPLTWHTPPTHQDQLYNFMTANHKNTLEINPMLPTFGRNTGMPLGSVDLSISSASRSTPSPKGNNMPPGPPGATAQQHSSSLLPSIPPGLVGPPLPDQNDHFHSKMLPGHPAQQQQQHHINTNRSPSATQIGGVIQSTAALKDRSAQHNMINNIGGSNNASCSFLGNNSSANSMSLGPSSSCGNGYYNLLSSNSGGNSNSSSNVTCVGGSNSIPATMNPVSSAIPPTTIAVPADFQAMTPGGLHIKDAKQINKKVSKNGKDNKPSNETSDLVKDIILHAMQSNQSATVSPKRTSPLRTPIPSNPSPTRCRNSPPSLLLPSMDPALSVSKSFQAVTADVPSTPEADSVIGTKTSMPTTPPLTASSETVAVASNDRTSPIQSVASNEDSADSNSSKMRRRRKPDRTNKMGSDELDRMHDFLGVENSTEKCDRIDGIDPMRPNIAVRNDIATLALEGISSLSQGLVSDGSHSPHITDLSDSTRINLNNSTESNNNPTGEEANKSSVASSVISSVLSAAAAVMESARKESESNSDDCETIDKIAAMISSTENDSAQISLQMPTETIGPPVDNNESDSLNGPAKETPAAECSQPPENEKSEFPKMDADKSYEEIENKLEEMFAGIEETLPACSKSPQPEQKKILSSKQSSESTDIFTELSEKTDAPPPLSDGVLPDVADRKNSPEPSTSGTQKKFLTPAAKRANVGKSPANSGPSPSKRKKVLKKKTAQSKGACFAAAEERASAFSTKASKKPLPVKYSAKKGNGTGSAKNAKVKPNESGVLDPSGKHRGPYVQIKSDGSHTVINAPINEEDADKPQNKTKKFANTNNSSEKSKIRGLHVSTLSTKYDADTTDTSWMCVFCKLGPHKMRLGDLFGPYIISTKSVEYEHSQTGEDYFAEKRTRESLASKRDSNMIENTLKAKKKKTNDVPVCVVPSTSGTQDSRSETRVAADMFYGMIKAGDDSYEVWMHEDCLVWAPGVHIIGTRIVGLEAAIWNCFRHQCRACSHYGATISCLHRGCSEEAHIVCARKNNWELSDEFKSHCDQHSNSHS